MKSILYTFKKINLFISLFVISNLALANGEPSTYFNIYVAPNNDNVRRNVALIVTAIYDSTNFVIIDDGMDGDTDDSKSGLLMAGQSYILYIKDNGINDDARYASGGIHKQDGDYFIIKSNKLVYASQSTDSDWQHDWVPSTDKSGIGQRFIIYSSKSSSSNRDINVFAYENNTDVTVRKISSSPLTKSGYTNVNFNSTNIVVQKNLNIGEDLIYSSTEGRNLMNSGDTYVVESNKPITVQYGALYGNERDGGGYVPSENGSSAGSLFYFGVPFQNGSRGEQEIRMISLQDDNQIELDVYENNAWVNIKVWNADSNETIDWVGRNNGNINYSTVFRVRSSDNKKVIVFESNWMETGYPGTSDFASSCSSLTGKSAGKDFILYVAPPGNEHNVRNPFTGNLFGEQLSHVYLFASMDTCHVTLVDTYTNGQKLNRSFTILPGKYIDCIITLQEWKSIYNGDGRSSSGEERPYVSINSDKNISVVNSNFNDNWMMYFGSSLKQRFAQLSSQIDNSGIPGDTAIINSSIVFEDQIVVNNPTIEVNIESGVSLVSSILRNITTGEVVNGVIENSSIGTQVIFSPDFNLVSSKDYQIETRVSLNLMYDDGDLMQNHRVVGVETNLKGIVNGEFQQSSLTQGISIESTNTSNLLFSEVDFSNEYTNTWTSNVIDFDKDGFEDVFICEKTEGTANKLYRNNGNNSFSKVEINELTNKKYTTVSASWADYNNDGEKDVLFSNNTKNKNVLLKSNAGQSFSKNNSSKITEEVGYYHNSSFVDYDNDGLLDVFLSSFMPTKFNELYHNDGGGNFSKVENSEVAMETKMSLGATWADYDNDGDQDLFVPNGANEDNAFFVNQGNKKFKKKSSSIVCNDGGNSVGSVWGDVNNDGYLDLFVANASNQKNALYINDKQGDFIKVTEGEIAMDKGHSHGCSFVDVDNDMDLDLYVTNDNGKKFLYINDGSGNLVKKNNELIEASFGSSMGQSWFDMDNDGDMDVFIATHSNQKNRLFINNGNSNNWIKIKLIGSISNKDAIGAKVKLCIGDKIQIREINSQKGIGGQNSSIIHFGLGKNSKIDSAFIFWPSGIVEEVKGLKTNSLNTVVEKSGFLVEGKVFYDKNNNCIKDNDEVGIANIKVKFNNNQYTVTSQDGAFKTYLSNGNYSVKAIESGYWVNSCSLQTLKVAGNSTNNVNIPMSSIVSGVDLSIDMALSVMRRGFQNKLNIHIENKGTETSYGVPVSLILGDGMELTNSVPFYHNNTGQNYTWILDSLSAGGSKTIELTDSVLLVKQIGDSLNFLVKIENSDDIDYLNNSKVETVEVVGAIDPNDILVSPRGIGKEGLVKSSELLTYTIRFQNVGTYLASNVTIMDQIPEHLDYNRITNVKSSHDFGFSVDANGLFKAFFRDINLPDSISDKFGSNGFISFQIPINESVQEGDVIDNSALIQFDYEELVKTNTVRNTIVLNYLMNDLLVYPNPNYGVFNINLKSKDGGLLDVDLIKRIQLFDSNGKVLIELKDLLISDRIDISDNMPGIYFLNIEINNLERYHQKIVLLK